MNIRGDADSGSKPTGVGYSTGRTGYRASEAGTHHRLNNAWINGWTQIGFDNKKKIARGQDTLASEQ